MKRIFTFMIGVLFIALNFVPATVFAVENFPNDSEPVQNDEYDGYYSRYTPQAGVGFHSYSDYVSNREKADKDINSASSAGRIEYFGEYDYIYIPDSPQYSVDMITDIFISYGNVTISFGRDDDLEEIVYYYNSPDFQNYNSRYYKNSTITNANGIDFYKFQANWDKERYYYEYDGEFFSITSNINPNDFNGNPLKKFST